jgi:MFS family permease
VLAEKSPSGVMLSGCLALVVGAVVTFAAIETSTAAVLFVGTAVAGLGLGSAFTGAYRSTVALASPEDRVGLITAIYIVGYLSTGIPAVIGGIATSNYGLHETALVYSVAVAVLAASAVALLAHRMTTGRAMRCSHDVDAPPGPGTVPPCPPIATRPGEAHA